MEDQRFPACRRLKKPAAFNTVYSGNQTRVKGQYFTVLAFFRFQSVVTPPTGDTIANDFSPARVGVVASKKVAKQAVRRNRLKRLMRENFRCRQHPDGFDFVVIARPGSATADNSNLNKELNKLWKRLHQRCDML